MDSRGYSSRGGVHPFLIISSEKFLKHLFIVSARMSGILSYVVEQRGEASLRVFPLDRDRLSMKGGAWRWRRSGRFPAAIAASCSHRGEETEGLPMKPFLAESKRRFRLNFFAANMDERF